MDGTNVLIAKMKLDLMKEVIKCLAWSEALYAAET